MRERLRHFLATPDLGAAQAGMLLRQVYLIMFAAQLTLALLLGALLRLSFGAAGASSLLPQMLLALCLPQLPLALFLSQQAAKPGGRRAALSATLLAAVLLATPAWFLSLALALGVSRFYVTLLLAVVMLYYALGLLLTGGFTKAALLPEPQDKKAGVATSPRSIQD